MKSRIISLKKTRTLSALVPNGVDILEEISADEGMLLTQSTDIDIRERVIGKSIMLGKGCSSDDWKEITNEEADTIKAEQKRIYEEEMKANHNNELDQ